MLPPWGFFSSAEVTWFLPVLRCHLYQSQQRGRWSQQCKLSQHALPDDKDFCSWHILSARSHLTCPRPGGGSGFIFSPSVSASGFPGYPLVSHSHAHPAIVRTLEYAHPVQALLAFQHPEFSPFGSGNILRWLQPMLLDGSRSREEPFPATQDIQYIVGIPSCSTVQSIPELLVPVYDLVLFEQFIPILPSFLLSLLSLWWPFFYCQLTSYLSRCYQENA